MGIRRYLQTAFFTDQAAALLARITEARQGVLAGQRGEALHDYRVMVRRVVESSRSWAPKALRREIERIAHPWIQLTNQARDLEVEQAMMALLLKDKRRPAREHLKTYFEAQKQAIAEAVKESEQHLSEAEREEEERQLAALLSELPRYPARPLDFPPRLRKTARNLFELLRQPRSDQQEMHRLRLAAKEIRYGLEPLAGIDKGIKPALEELTLLQRTLGEQRDWYRLAQKLKQTGAPPSLVRYAEQRQKQILAEAPKELEKTANLLRQPWAAPSLSVKALRQRFLRQLSGHPDQEAIRQALDLTTRIHQRHKRADQSSHMVHLLRTAISLVEEAGCREALALKVSLLHDVLSGGAHLTAADLAAQFGENVAQAVIILTPGERDCEDLSPDNGEPAEISRLRPAPHWVCLVNLADRLESQRFLIENQRRKKAARFARQTDEFYLPLHAELNDKNVWRLLEQLKVISRFIEELV